MVLFADGRGGAIVYHLFKKEKKERKERNIYIFLNDPVEAAEFDFESVLRFAISSRF